MIIKKNLNNKCIISIPAVYLLYKLGSVVHVLFAYFRNSEHVLIQFAIVGVNKFNILIHEVYTWA